MGPRSPSPYRTAATSGLTLATLAPPDGGFSAALAQHHRRLRRVAALLGASALLLGLCSQLDDPAAVLAQREVGLGRHALLPMP
jgi:hypothetical protein